MNIETILFDMDGVILDSEPHHIQVERQMFERLNLNISTEDHLRFIGMSIKKTWEILKKKHDLDLKITEIMKFDLESRVDYFRGICDLVPTAGLIEFLNTAKQKGISIGIGSSSPFKLIEIIIKRLNIESYFHEIVSEEFVLNGKPEPDIYNELCRRFKANKTNTIVFEDSNFGILAANKAGIGCVAIENSYLNDSSRAKAKLTITDFNSEKLKSYLNW